MKLSLSLNTRLSTRQATAADRDKIGLFLAEMLRDFDLDLDHYGVDSDLMKFPESYQRGYFGLIMDDVDLKIVGTFALYAMSDQVAEIRKMYLHSKLRGQGIGKQLLKFIEEKAVDLGFVRLELETATSMKAARALYEKNGFIEMEPMHNKARCQHRYFKQIK